jgi:Mg-chelatase subunit ChlD
VSISQPWWLGAFLLIPLLWWVHARGSGAVPAVQRSAAVILRTVIVSCVVLALSGLALALPARRLATVFVIDLSESVSPAARAKGEEFMRSALESRPPGAAAGIVAFGGDARVELSVQEAPELIEVGSRPDATRTDVARALRLAGALLPESSRKRIVLLSDGRENSGDARAETAALTEAGVEVDTVSLSGGGGADAAVLRVSAPAHARVGEKLDVEVSVAANSTLRGLLTLTRDGREISTRELALEPGERTISFHDRARRPGSVTYRAELAFDRDRVPQNDSGAAPTLVGGKPRVAVVEGQRGEGAAIARALESRNMVVSRHSVSSFPGPEELSDIDSVVLVDAPAHALTATQVSTLGSYVRALGRGLVAVGGESSWSLGDYRNTALEDLLPLSSDIKDPKRRPSIAQVLAVDTSGSMAACHCEDPDLGGATRMGGAPGGINKTDITRTAAGRAVSALTHDDEVGILAFDTSSNWVVPLQQLPPDEVVTQGLEQLHPDGGTAIPQALRTAVSDLQKSKASLKHIVLFTDGWTDQERLVGAARKVKRLGITLSVMATGEGPGDVLARVASAGGGRFYAGRDLGEIPDLMMAEVEMAARRYVQEGTFVPRIAATSPATAGLTTAPPLLGYVATTPKETASVSMTLGKLDDPLLATWRAGLGVTSAWTSDAKGRWARGWLSWEGFADFWSNVVRPTLPATPNPAYSVEAEVAEGGLEIAVQSRDPIPDRVEGAARVVAPDGTTTKVELVRDGVESFSATAPADAPGAYLASVDLRNGGVGVYRDAVGAVRSYSTEYLPGPVDESLLKELSRSTGGRFGIAPRASFDPDLPGASRRIELFTPLLLVALLLFPVDIALRRVIVGREDLRAALAWRPRSRIEPPRDDAVGRLLGAAGRSRASGRARVPAPPPPASTVTEEAATPAAEPSAPDPPSGDNSSSTVSALLDRKRRRH